MVLDAGQARLRAKGHHDFVVQVTLQQAAMDAAVALVNLKLPDAIQTQPLLTGKLRAWIFTARYI